MEDSACNELDDFVEISSRNWNRVVDAASKAGYREGIEDGSQSVYQEGFDQGYKEAFKTAFILGQYKSLAFSIQDKVKHPPYINMILNNTKRGACYICKKELQNSDIDEQSITEISLNQQQHSTHVIEMLYAYFHPLMKQLGIDINELKMNCG